MRVRARRKKGAVGQVPSAKSAAKSASTGVSLQSRLLALAGWLVRLPRLVRLLVVAVFSLCAVLSVSPIVDVVYLNVFYTEATRLLPSFVSVSFGLVMYIVGWLWFVGTLGEKPSAQFRVLWYVGIGILAVSVTIFWLVFGTTVGNAPL